MQHATLTPIKPQYSIVHTGFASQQATSYFYAYYPQEDCQMHKACLNISILDPVMVLRSTSKRKRKTSSQVCKYCVQQPLTWICLNGFLMNCNSKHSHTPQVILRTISIAMNLQALVLMFKRMKRKKFKVLWLHDCVSSANLSLF